MPCTPHGDRSECSGGGYSVTVWNDGSINVKAGDSLSKYSMAIYGDFNHMDRFLRPDGMGYKEIVNKNLIVTGERLYHRDVVENGSCAQPAPPPPNVGESESGNFSEAELDDFLAQNSIWTRSYWGAEKPLKPLVRTEIYDTIVVHHSGTIPYSSPRTVQMRHFNIGFDDIGYHFMIVRSGRIFEARRLIFKGEHVGNANTGKVGILVDGTFEPGMNVGAPYVNAQVPTKPQVNSLKTLILQLMGLLRTVTTLSGHLDHTPSKACPGKNLYFLLPQLRHETGLRKPPSSKQPF